MFQHAGAQHLAARSQHLDQIGVAVPAGIVAADRHVEVVNGPGTVLDLGADHVGLPGVSGRANQESEQGKAGQTHHGVRQSSPSSTALPSISIFIRWAITLRSAARRRRESIWEYSASIS